MQVLQVFILDTTINGAPDAPEVVCSAPLFLGTETQQHDNTFVLCLVLADQGEHSRLPSELVFFYFNLKQLNGVILSFQ